jgi:predicted amidohydrolase YtcJ
MPRPNIAVARLFVVLLAGFAAESAAAQNLFVKNVRLLDGTGRVMMAGVDVRVKDGRVAEIGMGLKPKREQQIDMTGLTIMPGLIDASVHLDNVPGSAARGDDEAALTAAREQIRRAYLASGVTTVNDAATLADKPDVIAHLGHDDGLPSPAQVQELKASGKAVVTTLAYLDAALVAWHPERVDEPFFAKLVPAEQRATAKDPKAWDLARTELRGAASPKWLPDFIARAFEGFSFSEEAVKRRLGKSSETALWYYREAIPLVLGSDAGAEPVLPSHFHGVSTVREAELLVAAGIKPVAAIAAGTSTAAKVLGLDAEVGTIEVGKRTDFIAMKGDPTEQIAVLRKLAWVVKDGVAHTPDEWLVPTAAAH